MDRGKYRQMPMPGYILLEDIAGIRMKKYLTKKLVDEEGVGCSSLSSRAMEVQAGNGKSPQQVDP